MSTVDESVNVQKVRKIGNSLFFRGNCAVLQVLKAEAWSSQMTFFAFFVGRYVNTFSIGLW